VQFPSKLALRRLLMKKTKYHRILRNTCSSWLVILECHVHIGVDSSIVKLATDIRPERVLKVRGQSYNTFSA
jgi:gamma-glutamyl:cysteine ligase YbdK (ATP-grasp superfamily)